jgi:hypothetical protein
MTAAAGTGNGLVNCHVLIPTRKPWFLFQALMLVARHSQQFIQHGEGKDE